jgi:transcriptional regulator with XRE-family HTH domain
MEDKKHTVGTADTFGERLKAIRGFLRLSREAFSSRHGIPAATLKTWELSQVEISNVHMNKLLNALSKEKIPCSAEWLLEGIGLSPFSTQEDDSHHGTSLGIYAERECFLKNNAQSLVQVVPDNAMSPYFHKGDYVGGIKMDIRKPDGKNAFIVYVKNKPEPLIRFLTGDKPDKIILIHANLNQLGYDFIIHPEIQEAYQIVWHRKAI